MWFLETLFRRVSVCIGALYFLTIIFMKLQVAKKQTADHRHSISDLAQRMRTLPNFWADPFSMAEFAWPKLNGNEWFPKMDVSETPSKIKVKMNVPDVDPQNISIEVDTDNCLTVSGSTIKESKEEGETSYYEEREEGNFSRTISLPHGVDVDKIQAFDKNGTMTIIIPKTKPEPKKKIPINT